MLDKNEETGEVLITTSDAVGEIELYGAEDYVNMVSILDQYCKDNYTATGAKTVRSMTVEDVNKLSYLYEEEKNENSREMVRGGSITEIPIGDPDALAQMFNYGEYGRYAYYSYDTPDELVKDMTINGKIYHGEKVYDNGSIHKFYVYDDNNGNRHIAETNNEGASGYRVPKYENGEATPVFVSFDYYNYQMLSEARYIIGYGNSWLASTRVDTYSDGGASLFYVCLVDDGRVCFDELCYSGGAENGNSSGLRPVVSLSVKSLEFVASDGYGTNCWGLK